MNKKVLITGGSGFIGQNVVEQLLNKNYEIHSITRNAAQKDQENLIQHEIDLMDNSEITKFFNENKFENLIHLAWYVGKKCHTHNLNIDWTIATLNLAKAFIENGGKCFVGAGTVSEYEYKYGYLLEDTTPTDPKTLYGNSKNALYNILKVYFKQNNCKFKWVRIFNLYGPNEKPQRLMPSVINSCLKNEDVKVSDCLKYQDYLYVKDTASGIISAFESDLEGAINICSNKPVQLKEIVNKIAQYTNFKGEILWGAIPAAFGDEIVVGNNEKLKSTGWKPQYTLDEGLKETINWWIQNSKGEDNV